MSDKFKGSPRLCLRDFIENEVEMRSCSYDASYKGEATKVHQAAEIIIAEADTAKALADALRDLLSRMREPGCAKHELGAFLHGIGVSNADQALHAYEVAAGLRAATPIQHAH